MHYYTHIIFRNLLDIIPGSNESPAPIEVSVHMLIDYLINKGGNLLGTVPLVDLV